jgi:hypothetical protein
MHIDFTLGRDALIMGYLDNFDNWFSNKYEKILKIDKKKSYRYVLYLYVGCDSNFI